MILRENSMIRSYLAATAALVAVTGTCALAADPLPTETHKLPGVIAIGGGLPIKAADEVIGGAAISGSPGGNDEVCVQAGLDKAKDLLR
jgi:uncharacterized protein GlcG (DUF336 family)